MKQNTTKHHMDGLLVLLLFGVFAVCILSVLLTGARVNRALAARDSAAYDLRTASQYLSTKVRQSAGADALRVEPFGDTTALVLEEYYDGDCYLTRIYCHDGYLRELFSAEDDEMTPSDGEPVLPAQALDLRLEEGLLRTTLNTGDGAPITLLLHPRGGEGAAA